MALRSKRLDDAAKAGWLYYAAGYSQDDIAAEMKISRQSVQRLIYSAVEERLIKIRLDHPIASCMSLAKGLKERYDLKHIEVMPSSPLGSSSSVGIAEAAAAEMERWLREPNPIIMAVGTGRTLKAAVDQLPNIECSQHRIVSLTGNIRPGGSAAPYSVIFSMADTTNATLFPMPLPVLVESPEERDLLHKQSLVRATLELGAQASVTFLGIGELGIDAPLVVDGFISKSDMTRLTDAGAVGEICGYMFDGNGNYIVDEVIDRVASCPIPPRDTSVVIGVAQGKRKYRAINGALKCGIVNGLITDETTAEYLLKN